LNDLADVTDDQADQLHELNAAVATLTKALNPDAPRCACEGDCDGSSAVCRLDRVKDVVATIFAASREIQATREELRGFRGGKSMSASGKSWGDLQQHLASQEMRHDRAWNRLCDPVNGLAPDHELCKTGMCGAAV
jgi:hypothetical protein